MAEGKRKPSSPDSSHSLLKHHDHSSEVSLSSQMSDTSASLACDQSIFLPPTFSPEKEQSSQRSDTESTTPSFVSMKSDQSRTEPIVFSPEKKQSCPVCKEALRDSVRFIFGHWTCGECANSDWDQCDSPADKQCPKCGKKSRKDSGHQREAEGDTEDGHLLRAKKKKLKTAMQQKFTLIFEGDGGQQSSLNSIYTELYITTGESRGQHEEHELRHFESKFKGQQSYKDSVNLRYIFGSFSGQEQPPRTVLTKGVAGIGKSFAVQKFILDWSEEEANQDVDFVFCLTFRELNLTKGEKSFHKLLTEFYPVLQDLKDSEFYVKTKILVILDRLEESRLQLDFNNIRLVTSVSEETSVVNLLMNLIQGNLLPNANIWITSRPAASNQIPAKYVDMVTEIRGFSDPQKEEYFRRRFSHDLSLADRIVSHIRSSQSLNIMCQIPIFCWISAVLFEEVFREDEKAEVPQTLTEMMAHFLFAQTKRRSRKYDKEPEEDNEKLLKTHREFLLKLGKLGFDHLLKNNLIFYEEDLEECGINVKEASVYSGFCNMIFKEEEIFSQKKVFFFVHLTIQEFFAALYVYDCFTNRNTNELRDFLDQKDGEKTLVDLLKMTVDKVMDKKNGHLYYFLRFLLGLMVEPNRRVLQGLLMSTDPSQDTEKKILTYLKSIRRKTISPDNCINLIRTMVEMRDHKVKDEIQEYLRIPDRSETKLTPLHCSVLAYMLQVSQDDLDVLDLKSFNISEEGSRRLIPAVRVSRKAVLEDCKVTPEWVEHLVLGLTFPHSCLRDLDLSNNDLKDSGVKLISDGLSGRCCRLKILRLSGCLVTETGCGYLASALKSNPSHLTELDLSHNHPGDAGEKLLSELKNDPQYKLSILNVEHCGSHRMKPGIQKYACQLTLDPNTANRNLLLSEENRKVTWVEEQQPYPDHPERFDQCQQVLCEQGLDGRCYLEMEVVEPFSIGLTYRTIGRKGDGNDCKLGHNNKSWSLICSESGCYVVHDNTSISVCSSSLRHSRVGVYLDHEAGALSFYRVSSDSQTRLHTFRTTFTDPLYPAVEPHSSVLLCQPT